MSEFISKTALQNIQKLAEKKINEVVQEKKWRKLFSESGENVIRYMDKEGDFTEELKAVFSKENMNVIAEKTKKGQGFSFPDQLHDELYKLLQKYGTDEDAIETYINFFSEQIIQYIQNNDPDKSLKMYLGQWRTSLDNRLDYIEHRIDNIQDSLHQDGAIIKSLDTEERNLKDKAIYDIDLSFFELDDDIFKLKFDRAIRLKQEMILVEGKSKEETLYRILNEIKQVFPEIETWVVRNTAGWTRMARSGLTDCILIPLFNIDETEIIPGNICIYIYNEEAACRDRKKIVLKKRTKSNLVHSLERAGMEHTEAYQMVENTHGLYASLKHKLYKIPPSADNPLWVKNCSDIILAALLIGKWTISQRDQEAFKIMTGKEYNECIETLKKYEHSENPLIIHTESFSGPYYQIASIEDSWELLTSYIEDNLWKKFFDLSIDCLGLQKKEQENNLGHQQRSIPEKSENDYSGILKTGILRSLIICGCLSEDTERKYQTNHAVTEILNTIHDQDDWQSIAKTLPDLCEASPESVMRRLEKELIQSTGMLGLFHDQSGYIDILWATELLVQQKEYRSRAIQWLWEINDQDIEYKNRNTPQDILERVLCAWYNLTELNKNEKEEEAKKAISRYKKAWNVIASCLPSRSGNTITPLYPSRFRNTDEPKAADESDAFELFISYLNICIETTGQDVDKWKIVIKALTCFNILILKEMMPRIVAATQKMNDRDKTVIKLSIRDTIYHHRRYAHSDWAMTEDCVQIFEDTYNEINVEDLIYDYLYIFSPPYEFPLLHPSTYGEESSNDKVDIEEQEIDKEIRQKIKEFNEKGLSVERLVQYANELRLNTQRIGYVIAHYFDRDEFDRDHFDIILQYSADKDIQVYEYIRTVSKDSLEILRTAVLMLRQHRRRNSLIADIISLQVVKTIDDCLIFHESDEIKDVFWKRSHAFSLSSEAETDVIHEALKQCQQYGNLESYTELLYNERERLSKEEFYQYALETEKVQTADESSMTSWYIVKILEILQKQYIDDREKSYHIARLEWLYGELIHWDKMKCFQQWIRTDPRIYARLVEIVCRPDNEDKPDPVRMKRAAKMYYRFHKIQFCPADQDGTVHYDELKQWVDGFRELLRKQNQSSICDTCLGELFCFSPIDKEGFVPCRSICQIIEESHTDALESAYVTTELNKRGVYSPNAGKGEMQLAIKYQDNAEKLQQYGYSHTAQIYRSISEYYKREADRERKHAEDEW